MAEQIFLEKNRNIKSINRDDKLNVNLTQKARLLPYDTISDTLNLDEQFNLERDSCTKYRLMFTVNPICTNVLYNMKTELVFKEGSNDCQVIIDGGDTMNLNDFSSYATNTTQEITHRHAIRDTEYSHPDIGPLVYHCGIDIFNNHMLRSDGFAHINKVSNSANTLCGPVFNTIFDYQRDANGNVINEELTRSNRNVKVNVHQYQIDNLLTFDGSFNKNMTQKDGWFGFNNVGFMEIPNARGGMIGVNKVMNNNKACEFIDMYPDRSLFSFIPKVNKYRKRIEKNWDYCITYPYFSDYEKFNEVMTCGTKNAIYADVSTGMTSNGHDLYLFTSLIRHNLKYGDSIRLYHGDNVRDIFISGIGDLDGDNEEFCFRVYANDINFTYNQNQPTFFKKLSNSSGCSYYLRKFKKVKTLEGFDPDSTIGKLAYGENIYGDRVAQIIYTDDIDVTGLKDNLGREVNEIYLTVVKSNRGRKLWYEDNNFTDESIEFSHCFGEVTSGIETSQNGFDYNIRKLHNIDLDEVDSAYRNGANTVFGTLEKPEVLESDIVMDDLEDFYGDIVEFNPSTNQETVLGPVYHRFNTQQRELTNNTSYYDLRYDVMTGDDYDEGVSIDGVTSRGFTIDSTSTESYINHVGDIKFPGNLQPEGYFYQPHYRIKIREVSNVASSQIGAVIKYDVQYEYEESGQTKTEKLEIISSVRQAEGYVDGRASRITLPTRDDYGYVVGDLFGLYNAEEDRLLWGVLEGYTYIDNGYISYINLIIEVNGKITTNELYNNKWEIVLTDGGVPTYASYIPKEQKFVWRDILAPSQVDATNPLSDMMFTNGVNYIHSNITFFLRRQDPFAKNGLLLPSKESGGDGEVMKKYKKFGFVLDITPLIYLAIKAENACL